MSKFKLQNELGEWKEIAQTDSPTFTGTPRVEGNSDYEIPQIRNITISTDDPTDSDGEDGDIWIKYSEG